MKKKKYILTSSRNTLTKRDEDFIKENKLRFMTDAIKKKPALSYSLTDDIKRLQR